MKNEGFLMIHPIERPPKALKGNRKLVCDWRNHYPPIDRSDTEDKISESPPSFTVNLPLVRRASPRPLPKFQPILNG